MAELQRRREACRKRIRLRDAESAGPGSAHRTPEVLRQGRAFAFDGRRQGEEELDERAQGVLVRSFAQGKEDARLLATERLPELRQLSYTELRARASDEAQVEELSGVSSDRYRRRTSIKRFTGSGEEELHIKVQVDDGSRLGRLNPLAEHLIIATPDGEMVGDYTMASEAAIPDAFASPASPAAPNVVPHKLGRGAARRPAGGSLTGIWCS